MTTTKSLLTMMGLAISLLAGACGTGEETPRIIGPCTYQDIAGTCEITAVNPPSNGAGNCGADAVEVVFSYTPASGSTTNYLHPNWLDTDQYFTIFDGKNPSQTCATNWGLTVGSQHNCKRREITDGECTPVLFEFVDIDSTGCTCN